MFHKKHKIFLERGIDTEVMILYIFLSLTGLVNNAAAVETLTATKMAGRCEKLVIAGLDITQNCKENMTRTTGDGRINYHFAAWDGQTLSFSGIGSQIKSEFIESTHLIDLVTSEKLDGKTVARSDVAATGTCKISLVAPRKKQVSCVANSHGNSYAGVFMIDAGE